MTDEAGPSVPDIGTLLDQLRERVEQREREGQYPPELSQELHEHFLRITKQRSVPDLDVLRRQVDAVDSAGIFSPTRISVESGFPGGRKLHAAVAKVASRQTQGILEQVQQFSDAVREALRTILVALEEPHAHVHADLVGQVDAVWERMAAFERGPVGPEHAVASLRARLEALEAAESARRFSPFFDNARFEETFRGTRQEMLDRYRDLAIRFQDSAPVFDIGCGRGEFLEILTELGVECSGVEIDSELVEDCKERGLHVVEGDGLAHLSTLDDGSLGGLVLIQVIEHLTPQQAVELVVLAREKLRPGGLALLETVNPESLYVFAHAFYVDPTHTQPVHPGYLQFLFQEAGFTEVGIEWRSEPPDDDVLHAVPGDDPLSRAVNDNVERLNRLLFKAQDYAVFARR